MKKQKHRNTNLENNKTSSFEFSIKLVLNKRGSEFSKNLAKDPSQSSLNNSMLKSIVISLLADGIWAAFKQFINNL